MPFPRVRRRKSIRGGWATSIIWKAGYSTTDFKCSPTTLIPFSPSIPHTHFNQTILILVDGIAIAIHFVIHSTEIHSFVPNLDFGSVGAEEVGLFTAVVRIETFSSSRTPSGFFASASIGLPFTIPAQCDSHKLPRR